MNIKPTEEMIRAFSGADFTDTGNAEWEDEHVRIGLAAVLPVVLRDVLALIAALTPDPCWFDHHGGCQAHGYLSLEPGEKCPHQEARDLLAEAAES